jgi:drug/metabolite transporter (DMT)-like permease
MLITDKSKGKKISLLGSGDKKEIKTMLIGGLLCGAALSVASLLQQSGMVTTDAGKAGFITSMYIVFVPIFALFLGKKTGVNVWISVLLAAVGLYFLSVGEGFSFEKGDLLITLSTVFYAAQILIIDHYANKADTVRFSIVQFATVALVSGVLMLAFEKPQMDVILQNWFPLVYVGVLSGGVAFTLQIVAQKDINPQVASIIMCFEAVFALLGGVLVLNETLTGREIIGCAIMFAALVLSQISLKKKKDAVN